LPPAAATGRPRRYCRAGCRQQAHLARRFAAAHGLGDDEVIVDRQRFEELQDLVYCLQAAVEDVESDLAGTPTAREVRSALDWLLDNARPLVAAPIEPKAGS
jgi:hypothetical protein